ncbi:hypothetical protein ACWGJ2_03185 [Streptomyces sp. NPDC054796]
MAPKLVHAALGDTWINCLFCKGDLFRTRGVKLNSSGMELMKMAWADETATGLICSSCGYVHLFSNEAIQFYRPEKSGKRGK